MIKNVNTVSNTFDLLFLFYYIARMFDFTIRLFNNNSESTNDSKKKKKISFIMRKIQRIKKWYQNRLNPNQWIIDFLKQKKNEYTQECYIKYNYHFADNYVELIEQLIHDINHQSECIQFVKMISKMPKRFSVSSASPAVAHTISSPSSSSSTLTSTLTSTIEYDSIISADSDLPSQKMTGVEIDIEIMILEYMVLKEHLGKIMKYLQDNRISITTSIEIPATPRFMHSDE